MVKLCLMNVIMVKIMVTIIMRKPHTALPSLHLNPLNVDQIVSDFVLIVSDFILIVSYDRESGEDDDDDPDDKARLRKHVFEKDAGPRYAHCQLGPEINCELARPDFHTQEPRPKCAPNVQNPKILEPKICTSTYCNT